MLKKFLPSEYVQDIFQITPAKLKEQGIRGVIIDLDNTLVAWDAPTATEEIKSWFTMIEQAGIAVTIVSNNNNERVRIFAEPLNIPFVARAKKPFRGAFKRAAKLMGVKRHEAVVVGDQLLTDILGGNRSGFHTVLVAPVATNDAAVTTFNRSIERKIMDRLKKRGLITWED